MLFNYSLWKILKMTLDVLLMENPESKFAYM